MGLFRQVSVSAIDTFLAPPSSMLAKRVERSLPFNMHTLEQIEEEVRQLPTGEQKLLLAKLTSFVATSHDSNLSPLTTFLAEWDATHQVTIGEKPTRERTNGGNTRLR